MSGELYWHRRAFCRCGWSTSPSFGNVWFAENSYPCCPECGASCYGYEMKTVAEERKPNGPRRWWGQPKTTVWIERLKNGETVELAFDNGTMLQLPRHPEPSDAS